MFEGLVGLFAPKNRCLGVDIGTTGVKIVELKKENNVPVLTNYSMFLDAGTFLQSRGLELLDGLTTEAVTAVFREGSFSTKKSVLAIPGFLALITFIDLPEMPESEIEQAVKFEAGKYIPTPIEEVSLGWEIIGSYQQRAVEGSQAAKRGSRLQIMVVSVPKNSVANLKSIAQKTQLGLSAMEIENFAVTRCLVGNDKGTFLIANIGARATDFTIVSDGVVRVTRSIDIGGLEMSRAIASGLGIDTKRADKIKKSGKINLQDINDRNATLVTPVLGMIVDEVKRIRELYHKKNSLKKIDKVLLTGGTSKMKTIKEYFSGQLSMDCQIGNSLARVGVEKKYQPIVEDVAPELTVALGLAMRGLEG